MGNWKGMFPKENRYFETKNGILYCGNCLKIMNSFSKEVFDLVITDPPYTINYKTSYRKDKNHPFCFTIPNDDKLNISKFVKQVYSLLKPNTAFYCFGSWKTVDKFKPEIEKLFKLKNIIIWVKNNWTAGDLLAQYGQQYECIFYANKGRAPIRGKRISDIWFFNRVVGSEQKHQNQKPVDLILQILEKHSDENALVLDPFIGSGTTAVACEKIDRRWVGIEIKPEYCEIAKQRLFQLANTKILF